MSSRKAQAQTVQLSILVGARKENTSNNQSVAGLANEGGGLLSKNCYGGMPSLLAGWLLIWEGRERKEQTAHWR